jgi:hypothetical protein
LIQLGRDQDNGPNICQRITRERLLRASTHAGLDEAWLYQRLGPQVIDSDGRLRELPYADLADLVWWHATGATRPQLNPKKSGKKDHRAFLGINNDGTAIYLLSGGALPDKDSASRNALTPVMLTKLKPHKGPRLVYGAVCRLGDDDLQRHRITFRQLPHVLQALGG